MLRAFLGALLVLVLMTACGAPANEAPAGESGKALVTVYTTPT